VALTLAIAAAGGGLAVAVVRTPLGDRIASALRAAFGGPPADPWTSLPPPLRTIAVRAVDGAPGAPTVTDAVALVAGEVGAGAADRLIGELAVARLAPRLLGSVRGGVARTRALPARVRIVTAADERRLAPAVAASARQAANRHLAVALVATGVGIAAGPEAGLAADTASFLVAEPARSLPAAAEAGDLVVCMPVWWRPGARGAGGAERAARLYAVVRAGRLLASGIAGGRAC
jgi:hypothetical protein